MHLTPRDSRERSENHEHISIQLQIFRVPLESPSLQVGNRLLILHKRVSRVPCFGDRHSTLQFPNLPRMQQDTRITIASPMELRSGRRIYSAEEASHIRSVRMSMRRAIRQDRERSYRDRLDRALEGVSYWKRRSARAEQLVDRLHLVCKFALRTRSTFSAAA